jgi:hypothetical protein
MLTAYFDDSGTHDTSEVVIIAGLFGNQFQWDAFSDAWGKKLQVPSLGKPPLTRFHMYDCYNSLGEFSGWSRTATDFLAHELGQIIIKNGIWAYACAVLRKEWDSLVTGVSRKALGDAEGFCARNCYVKTLHWASNYTSDPQIAFVFDDRPHRKREFEKLFELFQREGRREGNRPELTNFAFVSSKRVLPLQGADLVAWEFYQHAIDVLHRGIRPKDFQRKQMQVFNKSGRFRLQLATTDNIRQIAISAAANPMVPVTASIMEGD